MRAKVQRNCDENKRTRSSTANVFPYQLFALFSIERFRFVIDGEAQRASGVAS